MASTGRALLEDVAAWGLPHGYLLDASTGSAREGLARYVSGGGYQDLPSPETVRAAVARADLRGAGGAGFPTAVKLAAVADRPGPRVVVANGEEGEPASVKDRWLLRHRPHLVLDGLRTAAHAVGADRGYVYVSDPCSAAAVRGALAELGGTGPATALQLGVVEVEHAYVAGEETAVVRVVSGGEAKPTSKPPRPYESGVDRHPTLVANVESLARVALATRGDVADRAGSTVLMTVVAGDRACLLEVPVGTTVGAVLTRAGATATPRALLPGGFAGGIWDADLLDAPLSHDASLSHDGMRARGTLLGCGAIIAVEPDDCPVAAAADVASYLGSSSSGQCGVCVVGAPATAKLLIALAHGTADQQTPTLLQRRVDTLVTGETRCGMPDAIVALVRTLLANFGGDVAAHMAAPCPVCRERAPRTPSRETRFRVTLEDPQKESQKVPQP